MMTKEQAAAYVHAQSVAAQAEIEAMKAENTGCERSGYTLAWDETAFMEIIDKYGLGQNTILQLFAEAS